MKTYVKRIGKFLFISTKWLIIGIAILIFYYLEWPESYKEFFGIFYVIYEFFRNLFIH